MYYNDFFLLTIELRQKCVTVNFLKQLEKADSLFSLLGNYQHPSDPNLT
jgi:hypothetical protein